MNSQLSGDNEKNYISGKNRKHISFIQLHYCTEDFSCGEAQFLAAEAN